MEEQIVTMKTVRAFDGLTELQLAVESTRCCSYTQSVPELDRFGVEGFSQPIFSCKTCFESEGKPVGICSACAGRCHLEHEIIEVGDRNQFRCDCPTTRSSVVCTAQPRSGPSATGGSGSDGDGGATGGSDETPMHASNLHNTYGPNFENVFCICKKAYEEERDELIACMACNEWYHPVHLPGGRLRASAAAAAAAGGGATDAPEAADLLVCMRCVESRPFLRPFAGYVAGTCANALTTAAAEAGKTAAAATTAAVYASASDDDMAAPSRKRTSDGAADTSAADDAQPPVALQPWVTCLTCTEGEDDGTTGVCMACAATCHAGHVLGQPRIMECYCDCTDLLRRHHESTAGAAAAAGAVGCKCCVLPASVLAPGGTSEEPVAAALGRTRVGSTFPYEYLLPGAEGSPASQPLWCAARDAPAAPAAAPAAAAASGGASTAASAAAAAVQAMMAAQFKRSTAAATAASPAASSSSSSPFPVARVSNACMWVRPDSGDLLDRLCRCDACMRFYASVHVATWFHPSPEPIIARLPPALEAAIARVGPGRSNRASGGGAHGWSPEAKVGGGTVGVPRAPAGAASGGDGAGAATGGAGTSSSSASSAEAAMDAQAEALLQALAGPITRDQLAVLIPGLPSNYKTSYEREAETIATLPHAQRAELAAGMDLVATTMKAFLSKFDSADSVITEAAAREFSRMLEQARAEAAERRRLEGSDI